MAKLRQHTDLSLDILESVTNELGQKMREFQEKTCSVYDTRELKREEAARIRQMLGKSATSGPSGTIADNSTAASNPKKATGRQRKTLNLNTYKDHSLGDYVETIRRNGTVDSYSTESVSCHSSCCALVLTQVLLDGAGASLPKITISEDQSQGL